MSLIIAKELGKIYSGTHRNVVALDTVSFTVNQGEAVGILGPAGSGKSTLFGALAGLIAPSSGEILLNDRLAGDHKARIGVGYLPEHPQFPANLTALGALEFSGRMNGLEGIDLADCSLAALELVDLSKWADTLVSKLSREMTRRLALAIALTPLPHVLIVDEPAERLDKTTRRHFDKAIALAKERGVTLLHLAHSIRLLEKSVERVLFLERGRIVNSATISELIASRSLLEISADIGERVLDLPAELGHIVSISRKRLIVEIDDEDAVNGIIDFLRISGISIHSVGKRDTSAEATFLSSSTVGAGADR